MKHFAALAVGSALMAPLAAFAGGVSQPVPEPVVAAPVVTVAPSTNWTGFYGGASLGYGDINTNTNIANGSGVIGGILGGYRYDFGNWVAGAEADYDWSNADLGDTGNSSLDSIYRFKLQAGVPVANGRALVYGTAGIARADTTINGEGVSSNGWVAGIGTDYALTDKWILGGEVLWNQFNDFGNAGVDGDVMTIKARLAYRF